MTSMISSNKYLKKKKMKTQSKEGIKPTIIGSTLPKTGEDRLYWQEIQELDCVKTTEDKMKTTLQSKNQEKKGR